MLLQCGFPSFKECLDISSNLNPNDDVGKFISFNLMANNIDIAVEIGKKYFNHVIASVNYSVKELYPIVNLLNSARSSLLNQTKHLKYRHSVMCMSAYVGLLLAFNKKYYAIIITLFEFIRFIFLFNRVFKFN